MTNPRNLALSFDQTVRFPAFRFYAKPHYTATAWVESKFSYLLPSLCTKSVLTHMCHPIGHGELLQIWKYRVKISQPLWQTSPFKQLWIASTPRQTQLKYSKCSGAPFKHISEIWSVQYSLLCQCPAKQAAYNYCYYIITEIVDMQELSLFF